MGGGAEVYCYLLYKYHQSKHFKIENDYFIRCSKKIIPKHFNLRLKPLLTVILISTVFILDLSDYLDCQTIRMPLARNHNSIMQICDERI